MLTRYKRLRETEKQRSKKFNDQLLKDIDAMVRAADRKRMKTEGRWITACRGLIKNGIGSSCINLLSGKRKLKSKPIKNVSEASFSHYVDSKHYIGMMMTKDFENVYLRTIKPGCYIYMKIQYKSSKTKKAKKK